MAARSRHRACAANGGFPAGAVTLRYANQGDLKSLDPYTLNETTTNAHLGHVYEGLTSRGKDLAIGPGLAERWEIMDGAKKWRFHLRKGVKFHNGEDFTADDVIFSADRVRAQGSNFQTACPVAPSSRRSTIIRSRWSSRAPTPFSSPSGIPGTSSRRSGRKPTIRRPDSGGGNYAKLHRVEREWHGPFRIESHQPGVRTVFKANAGWWGKKEHNLTEIIFTPIPNDATRVAALLSGEVDVIEPVPIQDIPRVNSSDKGRRCSPAGTAHDLPRL